MNAPCSGAPLTAPHVTTGGLCRWKAINKEGRHVGLDFYDLLIEGHYARNQSMHYERAPRFRRSKLDGAPPPLRYAVQGLRSAAAALGARDVGPKLQHGVG